MGKEKQAVLQELFHFEKVIFITVTFKESKNDHPQE
jgi:hypothetical protein